MKYIKLHLYLAIVFVVGPIAANALDTIEFLSGTSVTGTVTKIDKNGRKVTFETKIGARTSTRDYDYGQIHAVTYRGKRYVITPKPAVGGNLATITKRTKAEVQQLIDTVGSTPPDWLASTRLNYPRTLDFNWPQPGNKEWNNQKFPGHYVWDVINPNQAKWREGVKLLHHAVAVSNRNRGAQVKAMNQLGTLYASLLEDWPRAAYWWQKAGKGTPGAMGAGGFRVGFEVGLAKCYYRMGNKDMAIATLGNRGTPSIWCELGEHDRALKQAEAARKGWAKENALLNCGDVSRHAGWYDKATNYYTQATQLPVNDKYKRTILLAKERLFAMRAEQNVDLSKMRDGTYRGRSVGYSGTIEVAVAVQSNRITSVKVTKHIEKQFYSALTDVPNQIVKKQSVKGIDATSSATITAEAIVRATSMALGK